ncbi:DUF881 domain-containing protein [Brevibacterium daeguense]|nr:DUF881 domain-containing protein [Brevibacterium daeguense]
MADDHRDRRRARRFAERRITSREYDRPRQSYSSSLLESLWNRTPEPDYAIAARNRQPRTKASKARSGAAAIVLGVVFTASAVQVLRTEQTQRGTTEFLLEQIETQSAANEELAIENERRIAERAEAQQAVLSPEEAQKLTAVAISAGAEELSGPGAVVTLQDRQQARGDGDPRALAGTENAVQDTDLQTVVNGLFALGAEGVAINGHRLTSWSAVRGAGSAILVNYDPVEPPYEVVAVGSEQLGEEFLDSPTADYLATLRSEFGIVTDVSSEETSIPAAEVSAPRYAAPADQEDLL